MEQLHRETRTTDILITAKVFLRKLPLFLLVAFGIGFMFASISMYSRERTLRAVRDKDAEIITSVAAAITGRHTPAEAEWDSLFHPLRSSVHNKKGNSLFGIALWRNGKLQYTNHDRLGRLSLEDLKSTAGKDPRYRVSKIRDEALNQWHIGFFRPELQHNFHYLDSRYDSGLRYFLSPLRMITTPIEMMFDPDLHLDVNASKMIRVGAPPFLLGLSLVMIAFIIYQVKDFSQNRKLAAKEREKQSVKDELEELETKYEKDREAISTSRYREYDIKRMEAQMDIMIKYIGSIDADKVKRAYSDFMSLQNDRYRVGPEPGRFNDERLDLFIRESSLFFVLSDYVDVFIETALPRYATMTEYCFKLIYQTVAEDEILKFKDTWNVLPDTQKRELLKTKYNEEELKVRAQELGFNDHLRLSLHHVANALGDPEKRILKPVKNRTIGAGSYITMWLLPLFTLGMEESARYARPILNCIGNDEHLFSKINDLINYRNLATHLKMDAHEPNSRQALKLWHDQFMEVWTAIARGYASSSMKG